jgi:hypothetical protein
MYDTFSNNRDLLEDDSQKLNGARRMILKVVNTLSAKMEIGAPMAALFLLQNSDYYTSHEFQPFYWKNFINYVKKQWENLKDNAQTSDGDRISCIPVRINVTPENTQRDGGLHGDDHGEETVCMGWTGNTFISKASTDNYRFCPQEHEGVCLYEWIQCSIRHYKYSTHNARQDIPFFCYVPEHPMSDTHIVGCDPDRWRYVVPNFLGPGLPRRDKGDREEYCMAMLTSFAPWRLGLDLNSSDHS